MRAVRCVRCRAEGTHALRLVPASLNEGTPMCAAHHAAYRKERGW